MSKVTTEQERGKFAELHKGFDSDESRTRDEIIEDGLTVLSSFLRDYQVDACRHTINRILKTKDPLLITLPTGAGKSWVLVGLSYLLRRLIKKDTGRLKKVLMFCPTPTLVAQNHEKMIEAGFEASIFCSKLGFKDLTHDIIIGSPISITNSIHLFEDTEVAVVFIDESHSHTESHLKCLSLLKKKNPNLRELGLTATPVKLGKGYIFARDTYKTDVILTRNQARDPYYAERVYDISPMELIELGHLMPVRFAQVSNEYEVTKLKKDSRGKFTKDSELAVFVNGRHLLNERIVKEVKSKTKKHRAVLIFAQNVAHADALMDYFDEGECKITHWNIDKTAKDEALTKFKQGDLKYLINVQSLTTGFDAPVCDAIIILRATESFALFYQIIGRGMRPTNIKGHSKKECFVMDFAGNIGRHCPTGDIFDTELRTFFSSEDVGENNFAVAEVTCPKCKYKNIFKTRHLPDGTKLTKTGYVAHVESGSTVVARGASLFPIGGTVGSQCGNYSLDNITKRMVRCSHIWSNKICDLCGRVNYGRDTFCRTCHAPVSFRAAGLSKGDIQQIVAMQIPYEGEHYCRVLGAGWRIGVARKSLRLILRVEFEVQELPFIEGYFKWSVVSPEPESIKLWLSPELTDRESREQWTLFCEFFFGRVLVSIDEVFEYEPKYLDFIVFKKVNRLGRIFNDVTKYIHITRQE